MLVSCIYPSFRSDFGPTPLIGAGPDFRAEGYIDRIDAGVRMRANLRRILFCKLTLKGKFSVVRLKGVMLTPGVGQGGEEPNNINGDAIAGGNLQATLPNPSLTLVASR
jgi:hypothetical protein